MKKCIHHILYMLIVLVLLSSCKTQNLFDKASNDDPIKLGDAFQITDDYQYALQIGDKVSISVWGQDELSVGSLYGIYNSNEVYGKWLMVDAEGNIEIPKIGTLNVLGKTTIELKKELKMMLSKWVVNPIVDVKVLNKEVSVLGEIKNPQVIGIDKDKISLLKTIAVCGGFDFYANLKSVKIFRQVGTDVHVATIDLTRAGNYQQQDIPLLPGDVLVIPSKKYKEFDKRVSVIIPFTTTLTAATIFMGNF